jgi:hypothetical protein
MPQGLTVPPRIVHIRKVAVDVLQGGLEHVDGILDLSQQTRRHQDIIRTKLMSCR